MFFDDDPLTIDEMMLRNYKNALSSLIFCIPKEDPIRDWSKTGLISIKRILYQPTVKIEDYRQICSIGVNILPSFSGNNKVLLNKILIYSLFHLFKEDIYDFVGISFYPEDKDLDAITLDGEKLTSKEFVHIQNILE